MFKRYKGKMFCFSPPVMLATFFIEIGLALYTLARYKMSPVVRLVTAMLFFLAAFQLAEYMVCGGLGVSAMDWARIGYVAITILPPLGLHLAYTIAGKPNRRAIFGAYTLGAVFMAYFLFATDVFVGSQCVGNYVIFQLGSTAAKLYGLYYYGLLFAGIGVSLSLMRHVDAARKKALQTFIAGYVLFMLPTTIANTIDPRTVHGIPSIMCGFAVLFALVVVFWTLPYVAKRSK